MTVIGLVTYSAGHLNLKTTPWQFKYKLTLHADLSLDFLG